MRNRKNKDLSVSKKRQFSPFSDLITNSQNTISSQASVISKQSYNYIGTQSQDRFYDFQFYQDIISEDNQQLRISPQQEKRIQGLLQFARKGKINPGNAFEVPLHVANPQIGQPQNMRFWKFASQLLHASMGIYDKRVQHVFLGANRMFDSLIRVGSNKTQEEQQPEVRQQKKKVELMKINIQDLGDPSKIACYQIASANCQQSHKISLKSHMNQFATDPLFNKKLQAFDSDSLKSLFLNVFQTGPDLKIIFFHQSIKSESKEMDIETQRIATHSDFENDYQSMKTQQMQIFPKFINEELKKLSLISQTKTSYDPISAFRQEVSRMGVREEENYVRGATQSFDELADSFSTKLDFTSQKIDQSQEISFNNNNDLNEQITSFSLNFQPQILQQANSAPTQMAGQQFLSDQSLFSYVRQSNSLITPWQYEFKGAELIKKKNARGKSSKKGNKEKNLNKAKVEVNIDFLSSQNLKRKDVFKCKNSIKSTKQSKYQERNLLPRQSNPIIFSFSKRNLFGIQSARTENHAVFGQTQNKQKSLSQNYQDEHQGKSIEQPARIQFQQGPTNFDGGLTPQNTMKNIRQLKQKVAEKIADHGEMFISQIDFGISPASMLVVVLHLVNQLKLQIIQESKSDIKVRAC